MAIDPIATNLTSILAPRTTELSEDAIVAISKASPLNDEEVRQVAATLPKALRLNIISDAATADDRLGFQPLVRTLANVVLSPTTETPLAIAVDGPWGSGKTSILKMVENQARLVGYSVVWLNAWALERNENLIAELTAGIQDELTRSGRTPGGSFTEKMGVFLGRALAALVPAVTGGQTVRGLLEAKVSSSVTQGETTEIASVVRTQKAFKELVEILLERSPNQAPNTSARRLLILIDDLDRAMPDQVALMLKNLKQLVEMEGCIFLLAMDANLVGQGIEDYYRARYSSGNNISLHSDVGKMRLDVTHEPGSIRPGFGRNYLEKLVQIILPVPPLSRDLVLDCVLSLGFADEATEIVRWAPSNDILNPRRLKRYLNTLSVTLQLVMASRLPENFDNAYALRAMALRGDWPTLYDNLVNDQGAYAQATWPEDSKNVGKAADFREYLTKLRIAEGDLTKFEQFLVNSHRFPARLRVIQETTTVEPTTS